MNIVVFGGGTVGKFGNDFCLRARKEGHRVIIYSHTLNGTNDPDQYVINYNDVNECEKVFDSTCNNLDKIDIVFFNQVGGLYPGGHDLFRNPDVNSYTYTLNTNVTIPHLFISKFASKFHKETKVLNMTTNLALEYDKNVYVAGLVGYAGGKAWGTHLIQGYARLPERNSIFFTVGPSMNYDSEESRAKYPVWSDSLYNLIISANESYNGKIITAWDLNHHDSLQVSLHTTKL